MKGRRKWTEGIYAYAKKMKKQVSIAQFHWFVEKLPYKKDFSEKPTKF